MSKLFNLRDSVLIGIIIVMVLLYFGIFPTRWSARRQHIAGTAPDWEPRMRMADVAPDKDMGLPKDALLIRRVFNLLKSARFDELNTLLDSLQADMNTDITREANIVNAFIGFNIPDPTAQPLFDKWVTQHPDKWMPYAARGIYFENLGWESRGFAWAKDTSDRQFGGMVWYFEKARENLDTAVRMNPRCVPALRALVSIAMNMGPSRRQTMDTVLPMVPDSFLLRKTCMNLLTPRWGGSYTAMDQFARDSQAYADTYPQMKFLLGMSTLDQADMALINKNHNSALTIIQRAIDLGDYWEFYFDRGKIKYYADRWEESVADFDRAAALKPVSDIYAYRALALFKLNRLEESVADLEKAMQIDPFSNDGQTNAQFAAGRMIKRGYEHAQAGDFASAETDFRHALRFTPNLADAHYRLTHVYIKQNRLADAETAIRSAIRHDQRKFDYVRLLDWILAHRQDWDGIINAWTDFLSLEPANGQAYLERGGAKRRKGDLSGARADAQKACDLGVEEACRLAKNP